MTTRVRRWLPLAGGVFVLVAIALSPMRASLPAQAAGRGAPGSPPTAEQIAERRRAEDERLRNDWANLRRYREANVTLGAPKPGEDRVVFMGNSITEGWV